METNILVAFKNLITSQSTNIFSSYLGANRINNVGEGLETYIKDLFCNSFNVEDWTKKNEIYSQHFSYLGNQNNPPDIMIRNGDAIEVKKIEGHRSSIALNSSYPKDKLYADSPMITNECRSCEDWTVKDLIYVIGVVKEEGLKSIWFVYGDCYAASPGTYHRIAETISAGVNGLVGVEFSETNELARVNKVDPLGITYMRIRGMWGIDNPIKVFDYIAQPIDQEKFTANLLILKDKYFSFPEVDRNYLETLNNSNLTISDVKIKAPNNPAELLEAKLIKFSI